MRTLIAICLISLLTSCATTGYNRSFIMGDNHPIKGSERAIVEADKTPSYVD